MKIAMLTSTFLPRLGGAEIMIHHLSNSLSVLGNEVHVIAPYGGESMGNVSVKYSIHWILVPPKGNSIFLGPMTLLSLLKSHIFSHFDIIHAHFAYPAGYYASLLQRIVNIPFVITAHAGDVQKLEEISYGYILNDKKLKKIYAALKSANKIIAVSNSVADDVLGIIGNHNKIEIITTGVNRSSIIFNEDVDSHYRKEGPIILSVGRNHPKKAFGDLVKAMEIVVKVIPNAKCIIVGDNMESLNSTVYKLKLEKNIIFPGRIPPKNKHRILSEIPDRALVTLYKNSDIFVLPSLIEGFPLVILEAMAAGLPIVATDVPGNRDAVKNGITGILVPPRRPDILAKRILQLLNNDRLRKQLGRNAFNESECYDYSVIAEKHMALYNSVVK